MATEQQQRILSIRVDNQQAITAIQEYKKEIDSIHEAEDEWKEALKEGEITQQEYDERMTASTQAVNEYNQEIRVLNKEIRNNIKTQEEENGSLTQLRAQLSNLTKEYDKLSREERENGERGKELRESINATTKEIKSAEEATTRYYRNVGNYENSIRAALGENNKYVQSMKALGDVTKNGVGPAMTIAKNSVVSFGKSLLGLLANPIVATFTAIAAAIMLVAKGISSSEQNSNKWAVVVAPLNRLLTFLLNVIQNITTAILSWVNNGAKLVGWIMTMMEKLPIIGNLLKMINSEIRESISIATTDAKLAQQRRDMEVKNAKDELEIAKLRKKAASDAKKDRQAQIADLKKADDLEKGIMKRRVEYAKVDLANARAKAAQAQNTASENDELAQKEAAYYNAQTEYYRRTTKLAGQVEGAEQSLAKQYAATGSAADDSAQRIAQAKQKELDAVRSAEDALIELVTESRVRESMRIQVEYERRIEDLKKRLTEEKDLTLRARQAIMTEIEAQQRLMNKELDELSAEQTAKEIQNEQKRIAALMEASKDDVLKQRELKLSQLDLEEQQAMADAEKEVENVKKREELILAIKAEYYAKRLEVEKDFEQKINEQQVKAINAEYEAKIREANDNELTQAQLRVEQQLALLEQAHQLEGESIEAWNERRLQLEDEYLDAKKDLADKEVTIEKAKADAVTGIMGGVQKIAEAFGEDNEAMALLSKTLALGEIAINSGVAISAGVKQAQSLPYPANLGAIATTVATILANIATAIKTVKSVKFAQGGYVTGAGTGTSDSIAANLSNGESVMTSAATSMFSPLLSAFNQLGGGAPIIVDNPQQAIGEDRLASAVAKGMSAAPRPVVSVQEITEVSRRVEVIEDLSSF